MPEYAWNSADRVSKMKRSTFGRRPVRACDGNDGRIERFGSLEESLEEFGNGAAGAGIADLRSDLVEGNKDEGALGETRVWNFERSQAENEVVVEDQVEIESARTVWDGVEPVTAEFVFDLEERAEQFQRRERGFENEGGVEEPWLISVADRRGGVERAARRDAANWSEARDRSGKRDLGRARGAGEVGAEGNDGRGHVFLE
jgi:hypothetical protein